MCYNEPPSTYRSCDSCDNFRHRDDMVSITDDRLLCIQCASKMISELKALLLEAVKEEPKTECAENGTKCAFCFKEYRSEWPTKGFHVVHADDCWLMRAKKAID